MYVLFRRLFRTAIFSRFSQVAIATSNFMNEFYNGGFTPEFSVSMLTETNCTSSRLCIWNEEIKSKSSGKIYMKTKYEICFQWNTKRFLQKVLFLLILDLAKTLWPLRILSQTFTRNCVINELEHWRTMYLWICYFAPIISQRYIKYTLVHSSKLLVIIIIC